MLVASAFILKKIDRRQASIFYLVDSVGPFEGEVSGFYTCSAIPDTVGAILQRAMVRA